MMARRSHIPSKHSCRHACTQLRLAGQQQTPISQPPTGRTIEYRPVCTLLLSQLLLSLVLSRLLLSCTAPFEVAVSEHAAEKSHLVLEFALSHYKEKIS